MYNAHQGHLAASIFEDKKLFERILFYLRHTRDTLLSAFFVLESSGLREKELSFGLICAGKIFEIFLLEKRH